MDASYSNYLQQHTYNQQQQQSQQQPHAGPHHQQQHHAQQQSHQQQSHPSQQHQQGQNSQPQQALGGFGSLSQHPNHQDSHATLPPLQSQNNGYSQFGSLSFAPHGTQSHPTSASHTPTSSSHPYPTHPQGNMLPPSSFAQNYNLSQPSMYPPSSNASVSGTSSSSASLPTIRPMPPGGVGPGMNGLPSLSGMGQMGQQAAFMQNEEAPTHVVGSQGRRGILPSAPGRPNAPPAGSTTARTMMPVKDEATGKFPCQHCTKSYLHAKHLKRHLLRHTGDRPYQCHLCEDTFSRSDILKRHFQKCSIRRGNPTGASHLAHQKSRNPANVNRLSISRRDGPIGHAGHPEASGAGYGNATISSNSPTVAGDMSARSSRANSLINPPNANHRNSAAGLGILPSNNGNGDHMMTSGGYQPGMPAYALQGTSNGGPMSSSYAYPGAPANAHTYNTAQQPMSFLDQTSSRFNSNPSNNSHADNVNGSQFDWGRVFNAGGQDGFVGGQPANVSSDPNDNVKPESEEKTTFGGIHQDMANESFLGSLYSHPGAYGSEYSEQDQGVVEFPNWSVEDPLQVKVDSLIHFCFPPSSEQAQGSTAAEITRACLTVNHVKHFAEHYTSFHGHWPILHMPTFRLSHANNSLVLAMICIGAVYSPKMDANHVRLMAEFIKQTIIQNSDIYAATVSGATEDLGSRGWDVEELQALLMMQILLTWHGDPAQRQAARDDFPMLVRIAKAMGLCSTAPPNHYAYSALHSSHKTAFASPAADFDWHGWLEQEKRNRLLYQLFTFDGAMVMFFNSLPLFDPQEVRLSLPADDAAWDARDTTRCANALGLNGPAHQDRNVTGTRHAKQPNLREALRAMLEPRVGLEPGSTNAYSKFILIHALAVRIIVCRRLLLHADAVPVNFSLGLPGSGPATPLSQTEWLDQHEFRLGGSSRPGTPSASPTMQSQHAQQESKRLPAALESWKQAWDADMDRQYPPSQAQLRRFGFSKDGVHFYFLCQLFLQSKRSADWNMAPDVRFTQVMGMLKRIKTFVLGDHEAKGQGIGSVGDIDDQYGQDTYTFDMKLLFRPYNSLLDSPVTGIRTGAF